MLLHVLLVLLRHHCRSVHVQLLLGHCRLLLQHLLLPQQLLHVLGHGGQGVQWSAVAGVDGRSKGIGWLRR